MTSKRPLETTSNFRGRRGQVVSMLALYSNDPSSNPRRSLQQKLLLKRTKQNKKGPGMAHF